MGKKHSSDADVVIEVACLSMRSYDDPFMDECRCL